ncbi:alpha-2,3 sialyltransferase [Campylobacter upsaliensis]|nr:alpha-2,3 sialyltransferase [Campylobacter upsaliensis]
MFYFFDAFSLNLIKDKIILHIKFFILFIFNLGKKLKAVFFNSCVFFENYYTLKELIKNEEYTTSLIFCSSHKHLEEKDFLENFKDFYPDSTMGHKILSRLEKFYAWTIFNDVYKNRRFTSAIYMCAIAVAMGYKELYLAGIDFYNTGSTYAYTQGENLTRIFGHFKKYNGHTQDIELEALELLKELYDVKIYCLCPTSPLAKFVTPPPPSTSHLNHFILENKPQNHINDMLLPSKRAYKNARKLRNYDNSKLTDNLYYRLIKDLIKLPSNIKHHLKTRRF